VLNGSPVGVVSSTFMDQLLRALDPDAEQLGTEMPSLSGHGDFVWSFVTLIPAILNNHWNLVAVVNPSSVMMPGHDSSQVTSPCIMTFDSLQAHPASELAAALRRYLNYRAGSCVFTTETLPLRVISTPHLENDEDEAIFLLKIAECIIGNPALPMAWFDPLCFTPDSIRHSRLRFRLTLQSLFHALGPVPGRGSSGAPHSGDPDKSSQGEPLASRSTPELCTLHCAGERMAAPLAV
jgi:hypothetical protein